jgi:transcription initiation factor TFIID TATA-box-binding protein
MLTITNIVGTVKIKSRLNIQYLNKKLTGSIKDTEVHWLKYRIPENNAYIAFYQSGKFLVIGKSFKEIDSNIKYVLSKLEEIGISTDNWKLQIHNLVINDRVEIPPIIEKLIINLDPVKSSFEIEQFPALIYKDWNVTFLLFSNGKIILTGAKNLKQAKLVIRKFKNLVKDLS